MGKVCQVFDLIKVFFGENLHPGKLTWLEPENHLFEKENHLPNLHFWGSMLIFRGVVP